MIQGKRTVRELTEDDYALTGVTHKQVDMKIGMDIATPAYQRLVNRIILIAGDSDFLPVLKLARTAGIDLILDPLAGEKDMRTYVKPEVLEHVDGVETYARFP